MKLYTFIILAALILSACQANNTSPTPIITSTLSATETRPAPIVTETSTPIPETAEQRTSRELTEAVSAGMRANNPESWTGQYAVYAQWYRNASHPELVSDAQLNELSTFMQNLRKTDQLRYFSENPENAKTILTDFLVQFVPGSITREAAAAMTVADLENLAYSQNEYLRQFLELRYRAMTGEETQFSPVEKIFMETDPNGNVLFHAEWENLQPSGNGIYGMWISIAKSLANSTGYNETKIPYTIPMYGRTHLNGKEIVRKGALLGDGIAADFLGYGQEREGVYNTYWGMRDVNGKMYLHTYLVAVDRNNPISIPEGSTVLGTFGTNEDHWNAIAKSPELQMTTLYTVDNGERTQLTLDILKQWHTWPPSGTNFWTGAVRYPSGGYATQFFDPKTGLMLIASEVNGLEQGCIFFGTGFYNPWP